MFVNYLFIYLFWNYYFQKIEYSLKIQYFPSQIYVIWIYFFSPENSNISENTITSDEAPKVGNFL
jgi:hypothetical protein